MSDHIDLERLSHTRSNYSSSDNDGLEHTCLQVIDVNLDGTKLELVGSVGTKSVDQIEQVLANLPQPLNGVARIFNYTFDRSLRPEQLYDKQWFAEYYLPCEIAPGIQLSTETIFNSRITAFGLDHQVWTSLDAVKSYSTVWARAFALGKPRILENEVQAILLSSSLQICAAEVDKLFELSTVFHNTQNGESADVYCPHLDEKIFSDKSPFEFSDGTRYNFALLTQLHFFKQQLQHVRTVLEQHSRVLDAQDLIGSASASNVKRCCENIREFTLLRDYSVDLMETVKYLTSPIEPEEQSVGLKQVFRKLRLDAWRLHQLAHQNHERTIKIWENLKDVVSFREAESLKRLTILAAVFLPLSLSSSILAMTTRFRDLRSLLYDWIGVFFLLGAVAYFLYGLIITLRWLSRWSKQKRESPMNDDLHNKRSSHGWLLRTSILALLVLILLISFLVGMLDEIELGVKILGGSLAGLVGLTILTSAIGILWILRQGPFGLVGVVLSLPWFFMIDEVFL